MTDTTKTEALWLADLLEAAADNADMGRPKDKRSAHRRAAAELRRLSAVEAERDRLAAECEALRGALLQAKASIRWNAFGECRTEGVDGIVTSAAAIAAIDAAMGGKE